VEGEQPAGAERLVGENGLALVAVNVGDEELELEELFALDLDALADAEEAVAGSQDFGLQDSGKQAAP
jgi:hypothetical protein